tara:strand:+ start:66790 stop:67071 length:282 start_codon:yes stop_codon:yes gene_type:complete
MIFEFNNNPLKIFNLWKYEGVVEVEAFSMEKPDLDELIKHMWHTHLLDFFDDDQGPNGSWILPFIKWDTLRESRNDHPFRPLLLACCNSWYII